MTVLAESIGGFDLGEALGVGLSTAQIGHLAGALFLGLFGLSALRRAARAGNLLPALWIAVAIGLLAGCLFVVARGFPDQVPDWLQPWTDADRLTRAAAVAILLGCSFVMLSAHWVRGAFARLAWRFAGLGLAAIAMWLASGWFADQVPDEARAWTGRTVVVRGVVVLALLAVAGAFWMRDARGVPHSLWFGRALTPATIAVAIILAVRWFGPAIPAEVPLSDIVNVTGVLGAIGAATCLLIAGGAYLIRERSGQPQRSPPVSPESAPNAGRPVQSQLLPVAMLLDESGRPVLPAEARPRSRHPGPAGA